MTPNPHIPTELLCGRFTGIRPSDGKDGDDMAPQFRVHKGRAGLRSGDYSLERNQANKHFEKIPHGNLHSSSVDNKSQDEQRSPAGERKLGLSSALCLTQEYFVPTKEDGDLTSIVLDQLEPEEMFGYESSLVEAQSDTEGEKQESTKNLSEPPTSVAGDESPSMDLSSSSKRPPKHKLYSAIGSLEQCSANSFGKMQSKFKDLSTRGFQYAQDTSFLIPPASSKRRSSKQKGQLKQVLSESDLSAHNTQSNQLVRTKSEDRLANVDAQYSTISNNVEGQTEEPIVTKDESPDHNVLKAPLAKPRRAQKKHKKVEMFRPSCDAYTPRIGGKGKKTIKFKPAEMRTPVQSIATTMGTLARPNFRDALRRAAMILRQHVVKIERRFEDSAGGTRDGLFRSSMKDAFDEERFVSPKYKCTMVRLPMARSGMVYGLKKVKTNHRIPTEEEIYNFGHQLFKSVQLSSECSIVCLIYVERLMELARVPLLACTWRPIFMCGLLLASKVWQDLSSWNVEFSVVFPQFSLDAINKLELQFLKMVKWDLYISSSLYAKYYFALRALLEKNDFRHRYNQMVGRVQASEAYKVQQRTEQFKEEMLMQLSRSM